MSEQEMNESATRNNDLATKESNFASRQETIRRNLECITKSVLSAGNIFGKQELPEDYAKLVATKFVEHIRALQTSY